MPEQAFPPCFASGDESRRDFLKTSGCFAVTLALLGFGSEAAAALPVFEIEGADQDGEKRYPIPSSDSVNIDRNASLIVARYQGHVFVFSLACPHENAPVKWLPADARFQCTKHDSRYDPNGVHIAGRATRNLDRYVIRRESDSVVVDLHKWVRSDQDPTGWAAAAISV